MPAVVVRHPIPLRAGHIYLPPAGHGIFLQNDSLDLIDPKLAGSPQRPIDFFLRSLAAAKGPRAVGVILSGMLNDGAMGLYAVRQHGGLGLVQEPATAEFDDMPKAAIEAEGADRVLAPELMPAVIRDFLANSEGGAAPPKVLDEGDKARLKRIAEVLSHQVGRNFRGYKKTTLLRRVARRMSVCGIAEVDAYLEKLEWDGGEARHLARDLMIGVTAFFRDGEAYRILESVVVPRLFEGKAESEPLRVWVAGCATGQEAYSVAMLLAEQRDRVAPLRPLSLFATDINDSALDVARAGLYLPSEVAGIDPVRLGRHFSPCSQGYQVSKGLREMIVFAQHNLISDPPFSRLNLIVCRNVFIYMEPEVQKRLLSVFQYALNGGGFLFLGNSESVGPQQRHFETISKPWRIFRSLLKDPDGRKDLEPYAGHSFARFSRLSDDADGPRAANSERLYRSLINRHGAAQILIDERHDILFSAGNTSEFLAYPAGEPSSNLYVAIKPGLFTLVRSAIDQALAANQRATLVGGRCDDGYAVRVQAQPIPAGQDGRLMLLGLDRESVKPSGEIQLQGGDSLIVQQLEQELLATREDLQRTIEHLRVSHEELKAVYEEAVAMNEELQSANEELESSKEELQSLNEELLNSNASLDGKVAELQATNNDLSNLFSSTRIATIFLDREYRIKRYTPAMGRLVHLIEADIGRPVSDIAHTLLNCDLRRDAEAVIGTGEATESEVRDTGDHWYIKRVLPYLAEDRRVDGVVITFSEVTALKRAQQEIQDYADRLQQQAHLLELAPVIARGLDGRIVFWNRGAAELYGWSSEEAMGQVAQRLLNSRFPVPLEHIRQIVLERGRWSGELVHQTKDGRCIVVASQWQLARDAGGEPWAVVEVNNDITGRVAAEESLRESELRFRQVAEALPEVVWLTEWSDSEEADGRRFQVLYASSLFERIWGHPVAALYADPLLWLRSIHPDDRDRVVSLVFAEDGGLEMDCEYRIMRADGAVRVIHAQTLPIRTHGVADHRCVSIMEDVTERRQAEYRLRQAAAVYECTAEGVMITDAEARLVAVNRAFSGITGYGEAEVLGRNPRILGSGRHPPEFYRAMWEQVEGEGHWQGEIWNRRKSGEVYPEWLTISRVRDDQGRVLNYVGVFSDISLIKRSEEQLRYLAHYDPLTDLPNRLLLLSRMDHALSVVAREGGRGAVLFLDLDRFKNINDSYGHPLGDDLLVSVARTLRSRIRDEDTLARLGGDEFVVLMESLQHPEDAAELAQDLLRRLAAPCKLANGSEVCLTGSIGISLFPDDAARSTELLQHADAAMYQAKENGRNTFQFYTETLTRRAKERVELETKLRRALENEEFVMHYQPQLDMASGRICGCEALIRWRDGDGELIPPARFIPLAEDNGMIVPLGRWALARACRDGVGWLAGGHPQLTLAVNLSPRQFLQPDLIENLRQILAETGFPAGNLELEITESAIMEHGNQAEATLKTLKTLGVKISIDDFGTGYSSLAYLKRFPIDKLKIDQSFVCDIPHDRNDMEIAAAIIAMSHNMGMQVLAEGVETEQQLAFLLGKGCDAYQGYLFSRPLALADWCALLARQGG
jgi:diguanylate cyclase (GGDEF)-like protein/PAS domain S-box-containing protein